MGIERLGLPADKILVVEDLPRNLIKAKETGLQTALVHHGQVPEGAVADYMFESALDVMRALPKRAA